MSGVLSLAVASLACGGDTETETRAENVDCAWFEGADNCMLDVLAEIERCAPSGEQGVWNADNTACTYPSGAVVEFPAPVPADTFGQDNPYMYEFTLKDASGAVCAEVTENEDGVSVTVGSGTYVDDATEGGLVVVSCPDGRAVQSQGLGLFACLSSLNGFQSSGLGGGGALSFGLLGGGQSVEVFNCSAP